MRLSGDRDGRPRGVGRADLQDRVGGGRRDMLRHGCRARSAGGASIGIGAEPRAMSSSTPVALEAVGGVVPSAKRKRGTEVRTGELMSERVTIVTGRSVICVRGCAVAAPGVISRITCARSLAPSRQAFAKR